MNSKNLFWQNVLCGLTILAVVHTASAQSWTTQFNLSSSEGINGIKAVDENTVWAASSSQCLRTTNGGATWTRGVVRGSAGITFYEIAPIDQNTAFMVGDADSPANTDERIYKTTDGGQSWTLQYQNTTRGVFLKSIAFWDRNNGITYSDPVNGSFLILTTTNGGTTWEQVPAANIPPPNSGELGAFTGNTAIAVEGADNAWFGTTSGNPVRVFRTRDKGRTWTVANTPLSAPGTAGIGTIAFIDSINGFAGGNNFLNTTNNLMRTTDGGKSWSVVTSYPGDASNTMVYVPKTRGKGLVVTANNGSFYSLDGGATWKTISSTLTFFGGLTFASPTAGWATGFSGNSSQILKFNGNLTTAVAERQSDQPESFTLAQNYPNPFSALGTPTGVAFGNPETRIKFQIPATSWVNIEVFDLMGQHVATLMQRKQTAGAYELTWDGRNDLGQLVPSGIYFLSLRAGKLTQTRKMALTR